MYIEPLEQNDIKRYLKKLIDVYNDESNVLDKLLMLDKYDLNRIEHLIKRLSNTKQDEINDFYRRLHKDER